MGLRWWAHPQFTRVNIEPIILKNQIKEPCVVRARGWIGMRPAQKGARGSPRFASQPDRTQPFEG